MASASDPFYLVRDTLEAETRALRVKFDAWKSALDSVNTSTDAGFRIKHEEMKRDLTKVEEMCRKVKQAVLNVQNNRARFPHIDDRELNERKQFVEGLERSLIAMRDAYYGRDTQAKLEADQRRELHSRQEVARADAARATSAYTRANSDFVRDQQSQQQVIRREQDQTLDKMATSLDRLGEMAREIDTELQEQEKIIDDVDRGIDEAQGKMDSALKSIQKLLKTKDNCQLATIAILVGVFLVVAIIAFYRITG